MSTFTLCIPCNTPVTIPEMLSMVMRQDADNTLYINLKFNEKEQCEDYSEFGCIEELTAEEILKLLIVEDDCGKCSLNILANICDVCGFVEEERQL